MKARRYAAAFVGMAAALSSLAPTYHTTRSIYLPGIKARDYVHGAPSVPARVFSLDALPLARTPFDGANAMRGLPRDRVKVFQMSSAVVANGHCSLSGVALVLHEGGEWTLSFRAHQNPWMTGPGNIVSTATEIPGPVGSLRPPIPMLNQETDSLKRNEFTVRVRCYGAFPARLTQPELAIPRPVLFEIKPPPFWVQRGVPYDFQSRQPLIAVNQFFDLVDRVEVEFTYR